MQNSWKRTRPVITKSRPLRSSSRYHNYEQELSYKSQKAAIINIRLDIFYFKLKPWARVSASSESQTSSIFTEGQAISPREPAGLLVELLFKQALKVGLLGFLASVHQPRGRLSHSLTDFYLVPPTPLIASPIQFICIADTPLAYAF